MPCSISFSCMARALAIVLKVFSSSNFSPLVISSNALASYRLLMTGVALMPKTQISEFCLAAFTFFLGIALFDVLDFIDENKIDL